MKNVLVNGTFDILHYGHLQLLNYARSLGDRLTVAIDSDRRVASLKGPGRPINSEFERMAMLLNLKPVDSVVVFDSDEALINLIKDCDVLVKGSDYRDQQIVGQDVCKELVFFERINEYSTTAKIQHIVNR